MYFGNSSTFAAEIEKVAISQIQRFTFQNFTTMKNQTKAAAQAAQASKSATAQVTNAQAKAQAHSAYDADLLALFDATADKHTDVHTTLVDVRNASAKGTALGDLLRNKWSEIFCAALRNLPHMTDEQGRIHVLRFVAEREGLAEIVINDGKRKIVSYRYDMTESEEQVGEGMSTLAIMREIRVPVTTTHVLADGTTYEVPLKQLDEKGNLAQVYEYKRTRMVAQAYNRYGFSSIVKKALRAAVDEVAGVVEPQPKAKKQSAQ